jgi:hypothetical protein
MPGRLSRTDVGGGVEPLLERPASESGLPAGQQGVVFVERRDGVGRVAHALDSHRVTASSRA